MISVVSLSKSFGNVRVLHDVSLSLAAGEAVGLVGPSGCGKTTLLRLIAGLELPDGGEIRVAGQLASSAGVSMPPHERGIGFAFQEPALWPHMTVAQNILFGVAGCSAAERQARLAQLLQATGLDGLGGRRPAQLSAGQARRVALARALAPQPRILLLDEPLTNVDAAAQDMLVALLSQWQREYGAAMIYVSHSLSEVQRLCPRVLVLDDGQLRPSTSDDLPI
jgi:iron(III) transport system ATP-binding protein